MRHFKRITMREAQAKDDSGAETLFFQIYFTVLAFMLSAAMGEKK